MSWKKVGSISRRPQFNYFHAPDATVDNVSVTQTIGGQLDLGEWSDASDNTRSLTIKNRIINVCDPSGPQDVATRAYVDRVINNPASGGSNGGGEALPGQQGPRGPAGVAGPSGPTGPSGPIGPRGIQGELGPYQHYGLHNRSCRNKTARVFLEQPVEYYTSANIHSGRGGMDAEPVCKTGDIGRYSKH